MARSRTRVWAHQASTASNRSCSARSVAEPQAEPLRARALLAAIITSVRALGPLRRPVAKSIGSAWYGLMPANARIRAAANQRRLQPNLSRQQARALARRSHMEYVAMIFD